MSRGEVTHQINRCESALGRNKAGDSLITGYQNLPILSPAEITWDYFILVSTIYYRDIEKQLNKLGMEDLENFIWVLDLKFYDSFFVKAKQIAKEESQAVAITTSKSRKLLPESM